MKNPSLFNDEETTLFETQSPKQRKAQRPLAERMRPSPNTIAHLVGSAKKIWEREGTQWLSHHKSHLIFWGPPGCGKTTLAQLLAQASGLPVTFLSAVREGVKEIRAAVEEYPGGVIFIDEIHRLSKSQQETLLPILERSESMILGATTEPPNVFFTPALLSRVRPIYVSPLKEQDIEVLLRYGIEFLKSENHKFDYGNLLKEVVPKIKKMSGSDARFSLNLLESCAYAATPEEQEEIFKNSLKSFSTKNHYDYISAMIKSMRGSHPDAALFYAILMLDRGEDPLFILRRCMIFASEDVGNADPQALTLATSAYQAVQAVGMPEGRIPLAQCVCYLASTLKSNRCYLAIDKVREWRIQSENEGESVEPPVYLTQKGRAQYQYPHDFENHFVNVVYLPESVEKRKKEEKKPAYLPTSQGVEKGFLERLTQLWKRNERPHKPS
jgi:putative ATPase